MMDIKIVLLLVLATSILMFGCAGKEKQQEVTEPPEMSAPADDQQPAEEPAEPADEPAENDTPPVEEQPPAEPADNASDDSALADLFQIDTDKPISDEGLDVSTPSSD